MCLPLLLNLTLNSVVFDLNHPKPHRFRGEKPATFLEVKKFRLSCPISVCTHKSSVISTQVQNIHPAIVDGWRSTKSPFFRFFSGSFKCWTKSTIPKPTIQNQNQRRRFGTRGTHSRFPPQCPPTRRWEFFHIRKDSPTSPRLQYFGSPQNPSENSCQCFVRTFCWGICQHQDEEYVFRFLFW